MDDNVMKILWCEEHAQAELGEGLCVYGKTGAAYLGDCRMVPMRFIPDDPRLASLISMFQDVLLALDGDTP